MLKFYVKAQNFLKNETGQDTVEYAVLIAIVATAITAAKPDLLAALTQAMNKVTTVISTL